MTLERTANGFRFNAADIVAMTEHKGNSYIRIETAKQVLDVRVTPTGLIRVDKIKEKRK